MIKRSEVLKGRTKKVKTGCGSLYITINDDEAGNPFEVFVRLGKAGGCASSQTEALGRLITLCMKGGIPLSIIIQQLRGIGCHQPVGLGEAKNLSCADGVAKALELVNRRIETETPSKKIEETPRLDFDKMGRDVAKVVKDTDPRLWARLNEPKVRQKLVSKDIPGACPECGASMVFEEGCEKCYSCGYTKC